MTSVKLISCYSSCPLAFLFPLSSSSRRLFGVDDDQGEGTESEGSEVMETQTCPSYAATAALPASGPVTATLTG